MNHKLMSRACALAALLAAAQAHALDWTLLGDVQRTGDALALTTAYDDADEGPFNLSGTAAAWIDQVEAAAGVAQGALDLPDEPAYEGSLARTTFTVAAGDTLSFNWSFSTLEALFQDRAFAVVNGQLFTLATRAGAVPGSGTFSITFASPGTATLALGVVDTGDVLGVSSLNVQNVTLAPVPEPAGWALWLGGAALLAGVGRMRRQR